MSNANNTQTSIADDQCRETIENDKFLNERVRLSRNMFHKMKLTCVPQHRKGQQTVVVCMSLVDGICVVFFFFFFRLVGVFCGQGSAKNESNFGCFTSTFAIRLQTTELNSEISKSRSTVRALRMLKCAYVSMSVKRWQHTDHDDAPSTEREVHECMKNK